MAPRKRKQMKSESPDCEEITVLPTPPKPKVPEIIVSDDEDNGGSSCQAKSSRSETSSSVSSSNNITHFTLKNVKRQCKDQRCFKLLEIYNKYKTELSCSGAGKEHEVWRNIADEIREKLSLNCDESECKDKIKGLRHVYQVLKKKKQFRKNDEKVANFFSLAKKAFEIPNGSGMSRIRCRKRKNNRIVFLQVYGKYMVEHLCPDPEKEGDVWRKISDELRQEFSFSCDESQCKNKIKELFRQYQDIKRRKHFVKDAVMTVSEIAFFNEAKKIFEIANNSDVPNSQANETIKKIPKYIPPHLRNHENKQSEPVLPLKTESIPHIQLSDTQLQCTKSNKVAFLQIYSKYMVEHLCPDAEKKCEVWGKIAGELQQKFSVRCNESQCKNKIKDLFREYQDLERRKYFEKDAVMTMKETAFFNEAKKVFEITNNSCLQHVKLKSAQLRLRKEKRIIFLQIFGKYKQLLSSPDSKRNNEMWKKFADEVRHKFSINCDESQCKGKIKELRSVYEALKKRLYRGADANMATTDITFFKEAKKIFEITNNLVWLSSSTSHFDRSSHQSQTVRNSSQKCKSGRTAAVSSAKSNSYEKRMSLNEARKAFEDAENSKNVAAFAHDNVWLDANRYYDAERRHYEITLAECSFEVHKRALDDEILSEDYKSLLLNGPNYDLTLAVADKKFRVHQSILMVRSPVFHAMLIHNMKEKKESVINVPDICPQVMEQFLLYLYCGKVETLNKDNALGLYGAADKYSLPFLKQQCTEFIKQSLSPSIICDVIQLASNRCDGGLLQCATEYFVNHTCEIFVTVQWMSFLNTNSAAANELLIKASKKWSTAK